MAPNKWKTLSSRTILDHSKYLRVEDRTIQITDGKVIKDWAWITTPDFVNVVAVTAKGEFLCLKQTKYALNGMSLAPVGGFIDPGEKPLATAKRELLEEMGCKASRWIRLGSYRVDPNRGVAMGHLFLALGAKQIAKPDADDLEELIMVKLSRRAIEISLTKGAIKVLAWAAAFSLALRHIKK